MKTTHRGDLEWPAFVRPLKRLDEEYGVSAEEANANYNPHTQQYDVAMLTLSRLLGLTPMRGVNSSEIYLWIPGVVARIIGWGTISYNGRASNWLLEANAPIRSDLECAAAYGSIPASAPNPPPPVVTPGKHKKQHKKHRGGGNKPKLKPGLRATLLGPIRFVVLAVLLS